MRLRKYKLSMDSLSSMCFSLVRPILELGKVVWDNCTGKLLESVQIEAARIITDSRRNSSVKYIYDKLGFVTLNNRLTDTTL